MTRRKSQASASSKETPIAHFSMAAITGFLARSGRRDVPGEVVHAVARHLEKAGDVAARAVEAVGAADDDDADVRILVHGGDELCDLRAGHWKLTTFIGGRSKISSRPLPRHPSPSAGHRDFADSPSRSLSFLAFAHGAFGLPARCRAVSRIASTMPR